MDLDIQVVLQQHQQAIAHLEQQIGHIVATLNAERQILYDRMQYLSRQLVSVIGQMAIHTGLVVALNNIVEALQENVNDLFAIVFPGPPPPHPPPPVGLAPPTLID